MTKKKRSSNEKALKVYRDGGDMTPSKNLTVESKSHAKRSAAKKKASLMISSLKSSRTHKKMSAVLEEEQQQPILFNGSMRKTFVEGVLQDIKGMLEQKTDGKVAVLYADYELKGHEFGFTLVAEKTSKCSKQMWSEASSAIVNAVNYMFPADGMNMDVTICAEDNSALEVELVSNW